MKRKGQVTLFVIIAAVIVVAILAFIFLRGGDETSTQNLEPDFQVVRNFVDSCLSDTAHDAVYYIGQSGGYFLLPDASTETQIAYYLDQGDNIMIQRYDVEKELSGYVETMLPFCFENFADYGDYEIVGEEPKVTSLMEEGKVSFELDYTLSVRKGDKTILLKEFESEVPVDLLRIHSFAEEYIKEQQPTSDALCLGCLNNLVGKYDLQVRMHEYDSNTILFAVIHPESKLNEEDYFYYFAIRLE